MSPRAVVLFGIGGLALLCVAGLVFALLPMLPFTYQQARQRWEQRGPRHYEVEAAWASGWSFGHVRVEVLDEQIIAGIDLDTGQPLNRQRLATSSLFASIDNLFRMIGAQIRPATTWRYQLARYHSLLAKWLDPCAALMPQIAYDPELGYPTHINYRGSPCLDEGSVRLQIEHFRALP
jgi:Family of unknown function (DUF6174)